MTDLAEHPALVYVIAPDENGPCKIGKTINLPNRYTGIQSASWMPLAVFGVRVCLSRKETIPGSLAADLNRGAYAAETATHKALKDCDLHLRGEWFDVSAKEALQAIEKASDNAGLSAIGLDKLNGLEIPESESKLLATTHATFLKTLTRINAFCVDTIDNLSAVD